MKAEFLVSRRLDLTEAGLEEKEGMSGQCLAEDVPHSQTRLFLRLLDLNFGAFARKFIKNYVLEADLVIFCLLQGYFDSPPEEIYHFS